MSHASQIPDKADVSLYFGAWVDGSPASLGWFPDAQVDTMQARLLSYVKENFNEKTYEQCQEAFGDSWIQDMKNFVWEKWVVDGNQNLLVMRAIKGTEKMLHELKEAWKDEVTVDFHFVADRSEAWWPPLMQDDRQYTAEMKIDGVAWSDGARWFMPIVWPAVPYNTKGAIHDPKGPQGKRTPWDNGAPAFVPLQWVAKKTTKKNTKNNTKNNKNNKPSTPWASTEKQPTTPESFKPWDSVTLDPGKMKEVLGDDFQEMGNGEFIVQKITKTSDGKQRVSLKNKNDKYGWLILLPSEMIRWMATATTPAEKKSIKEKREDLKKRWKETRSNIMNNKPVKPTIPVAEKPVIVGPVAEKPVIVGPVVEKPAPAEPVVENPVIVGPVAKKPVIVGPVVEKPAPAIPVVAEPAKQIPPKPVELSQQEKNRREHIESIRKAYDTYINLSEWDDTTFEQKHDTLKQMREEHNNDYKKLEYFTGWLINKWHMDEIEQLVDSLIDKNQSPAEQKKQKVALFDKVYKYFNDVDKKYDRTQNLNHADTKQQELNDLYEHLGGTVKSEPWEKQEDVEEINKQLRDIYAQYFRVKEGDGMNKEERESRINNTDTISRLLAFDSLRDNDLLQKIESYVEWTTKGQGRQEIVKTYEGVFDYFADSIQWTARIVAMEKNPQKELENMERVQNI